MSKSLHIAGVGLIAPGLMGWEEGRRLLGDATAEHIQKPLGADEVRELLRRLPPQPDAP